MLRIATALFSVGLLGTSAPKAPQQPTEISVTAIPWADVWVDGKPIGTTAVLHLPVAPGSHLLRLANPPLQLVIEKTIYVEAQKNVRIHADMRAKTLTFNGEAGPQGPTLSVAADPWAEVWVDGKSIGTTPLVHYSLGPGSHSLRFVNGRLVMERTITLQPDNDLLLRVDLQAQTRKAQ